jgi:16S rRNA (adenine1518-N6/adenine1519-N6)-dimethyltransferase
MRRRSLGQHYLVDTRVVKQIVGFAAIQPSERVLEIGTGKGILTKELVGLGASFLGYEVDEGNYRATKEVLRGTKAKVVCTDAFIHDPEFDVLVTSLPYSKSESFIRWLGVRDFSRAVAVLQKDFVEKILAPPGSRTYRGISALAQIAFEIRILSKVARSAFKPPPKVDSLVVSFAPRRKVPKEEVTNVIRLFSLRRREVDSALAELGIERRRTYGRMRVFSLAPEEVDRICRPSGTQ